MVTKFSPPHTAEATDASEANVLQLLPNTQLANVIIKKRLVAGLYSVAEHMMAQSSKENKAEVQIWKKDQLDASLHQVQMMREA